ncbi:copper amine oxidase N-terminal domain-containing protein [Paenibacillus sp. MWE-103]|uniref:Copper amine oxidase N-terminal domain-containing protein n=1 Tax=Paenibacillus artemisiicola TaxID=1172618 RepID=A0ABS3WKI4_9BACL|nr:copper amine oxidase N-terminal domain-containing protein [Paenibacillus artemisiicola]MBO7748738.1 copper amine oxidase N-terminal domain-containing protein [Paenibacillus artemisiicola]
MAFIKNFLVAVVFLSVVSAFNPNVSKASGGSIFLNIEGYFLLYSAPLAPYIDDNNRMMVPLRSFSKLFGATATYEVASKTATIIEGNASLKLKANSKVIEVNGQKFELDTVTVLKNNSFFLPLKSVADAFRIRTSVIDMGYGTGKTITINDERFLVQGVLKEINEMRSNDEEQYKNYGVFPESIAFNKNNQQIKIHIKSRNILGEEINFEDVKSGVWVVSNNEIQQVLNDVTEDLKIGKGEIMEHQYPTNNKDTSKVEFVFYFPRIHE